MGKNIIAQARGKGGPRYLAPSFRYAGEAKHRPLSKEAISGTITELIHCQGHSSPLTRITYTDGQTSLMIAPEGVRIGDTISCHNQDANTIGNTLFLKDVPEGAFIFNIEAVPGDGGKFVRASGTFARVAAKQADKILIKLPSRKLRTFHPLCRATIGVVAGSGRYEKPFVKAGQKFFKMQAKNKLWPRISGGAVNAVDHPFGNKRTSRKSKARPAPRHAGPGRKVGMIRPRRTGRKTGKTLTTKVL